MTPNQARAARAMLNLDMKTVCELAPVGKRTLTEFESGGRAINDVTMSKLKAFYISRGISFGNAAYESEAVIFKVANTTFIENDRPIRKKREYVDLFDANEIEKGFSAIEEILRECESEICFSRKIVLAVLNIRNLNQKELAGILECSPAFINAIVVGKKYIPPAIAEKLQSSLGELPVNIKAAVESERKLKSAISEMLKISGDAGQVIKAVYPGISSA